MSFRSLLVVGTYLLAMNWAGAQQTPQAPPPTPSVKVGDMAPDFTLKDQNGKEVSLHDFRGKQNVAVTFFVFAFSPA
jgi:cytochrome oxidase Cu insertion factor (SCO1/SenC/PrrC family)